MHSETASRFKRWFWRPPRRHGEPEMDRQVSSLELLYDLVYVALIAQASHRLTEAITARSVVEFAIVFGLIWVAWMNGSLYLEIHGRQDGRTRSFTFLQMGILALLAVFTEHAPDTAGRQFALVDAAFLTVLAWLWWSVRRRDSAEFLEATGFYLVGMAISIGALVVSAFLPDDPRLVIWALVTIGWVATQERMAGFEFGINRGVSPTESLAERFGLFTIIVLGEVVFGVVEGLSSGPQDGLAIVTGMLALGVGFGLWWVYFDVVGGRLPRAEGHSLAHWFVSHLPVTLAIAATGPAMISLIEHSGEAATPAATAWLLAGGVGLLLVAVIGIIGALADAERLAPVYRPLRLALVAGAGASLVLGFARPAPWLLALSLGAILAVLWVFVAARFLAVDAWGTEAEGIETSRPSR